MRTRTAWIVYSLLRLLMFAAPFAALYMMGWPWYLAAIVASLVAVSLSVLFLSKPRERAALSIQEWRDQERTADDVVEDAALDSDAATSNAAVSSAAVADATVAEKSENL